MIKALRSLAIGACASVAWLALLSHAQAAGEKDENLPPYKMIRSLQHVQDSIVHGDLSSADMQQFMLGAIDKRLMAADRSVFADPRNVDAALIYAMSGGNPKTLAYLASRDIDGNFDNRITDSLGHYLNGKGGLIVETLSKTIEEYKNAPIGPYLFLVYGNAVAQQDPRKAVKAYDWARLVAPGTNIEEAALRRSLTITTHAGKVDEALRYSLAYTRRFMTSPYAGQFADTFVELAVASYGDATRDRIEEILSFMDKPRQREVFLRLARNAAIAGLKPLTKLASERAAALSAPGDAEPNALASFYSNLVDVPTTGILEAVKDIESIPDVELSARDRSLREAAQAVAREVLRAPVAPVETPVASSAQAHTDTQPLQTLSPEALSGSGSKDSPFAAPAAPAPSQMAEKPAAETAAASEAAAADPALATFLTSGKNKLGEIDALLREDK
ncbi:chemotaxis protein [Rhizobium sp. Leaf384]|uniref:chemotaxis protein MotC n=1 Tax=unclassified Rhizobium TaxID=2613769 RepID=UPI000715AF18|nr:MULTISPECIES: chemotaxis protein MotC [unclassified Rhizobium]KQR77737.1 chemotaxis protein [Rhizobium sp. Leaf341]KQS80954.1 chemotaxis protein [Rhizobium sp. Leaf384]KQS86814.1 chemotaxis protein [Rhizobium sp. Leaf383]